MGKELNRHFKAISDAPYLCFFRTDHKQINYPKHTLLTKPMPLLPVKYIGSAAAIDPAAFHPALMQWPQPGPHPAHRRCGYRHSPMPEVPGFEQV